MQRRRVFRWHTKGILINGLRVFWVSLVLWLECGVFLWSLRNCSWPDFALATPPEAHILIVADPQVLDNNSYPGRSKWLMALTRYVVDLNLRRSWNAAMRRLDPNIVVFLGDMMDNGRANMSDYEYAQYYSRFKSIFRLQNSVSAYYLPGNHDVSLGSFLDHSPQARDRYKQHFGAFNQKLEIANHTLVLLDAPGLVDEDYRRHASKIPPGQVIPGTSTQFLHGLSSPVAGKSKLPILLFSHIPLSRAHRSSCGPLRERDTIHQGTGLGYQNLLLPDTSTFILESVRPAVIFSGDDHDYCEYWHVLRDETKVREVTVKSFSMAMGIRRPGFQLLSLSAALPIINPPVQSPITFADVPCFLPNQLKIYTHGYALLSALTILLLCVINFMDRNKNSSFARTKSRESFSSRWNISIPLGSTSATQRHIPGSPYPSSSENQSARERFIGGEDDFDSPSVLPIAIDSRKSDLTSTSHNPSFYRDATSPLRSRAISACWSRGQRTWYGGAMQDLCSVAWLPICIYSIMSFWTFRP